VGHEVGKLLRSCQGGRARLAHARLAGACEADQSTQMLSTSFSTHAIVLCTDRLDRVFSEPHTVAALAFRQPSWQGPPSDHKAETELKGA